MKNKKIFIFILVFVVLAGFGGWFIYRDLRQPKPEIRGEIPENLENLTAEEIKKQMPNLDKEIVVKAEMALEQADKIKSEIEETRKNLKEDYNNLANWLQLGLLYKALGDFQSAAESWEFATLIRPKDSVAFHNLGDLYWLDLPDFPKAEAYFKKAIELNPHPLFYQKLHELYRYSYKEKSDLADDVLLESLRTNPGNLYLTALLADYYRDTGNISAAVLYYEKALDLEPTNVYLKQNLEKLKAKN